MSLDFADCSFLQRVGEFLIHQTNGHTGRRHGGRSDGGGPFPPAGNTSPALRSHRESSGDPLRLREQMCFHKQKWTQRQKICHFSPSPSQPPGDNCAVHTHSSAGVQGPWGTGEAGYRKGAWGSQGILCVSCLHGLALNVASGPATPALSRFPAAPTHLCRTRTGWREPRSSLTDKARQLVMSLNSCKAVTTPAPSSWFCTVVYSGLNDSPQTDMAAC